MKKLTTKGTALHRAATSCLVGAVIMSLAQPAVAFAPAEPSVNAGKESCAFSLELQRSVSSRRQYLVKVDQALAGGALAGNAVEDMYGNIRPAAYSPEDDAPVVGKQSIGAMFFGRPASKKVVSIDDFSTDCVSCHDGASASSIGVNLRNTPFGRKSQVTSFTSDHPIGMNYDSYVAAKRGFKPIGMNKMLFVDGKVGCLTCHDPLNPEKGHLVMSDRNSALCTTCHDK
jgi:predicted CXXCH cytochrome family protein